MPKIKQKSASQKAHDVANRRLSENFEQQSQRLLQNMRNMRNTCCNTLGVGY